MSIIICACCPYPLHVQVWPRDQLLLLRTEDYKAAPQEHVAAVAKFLGAWVQTPGV